MTGKRIALLIGLTVLVVLGVLVALAMQGRESSQELILPVAEEPNDGRFRLPRAIDFPATGSLPEEERASEVAIESDPRAREFEAVLTEGLRAGPNFAGVYTVVTWGCGTACQLSAILDARSGEILQYGIVSSYGVAYSTTTTLFAVNPRDRLDASGENAPQVVSDYYIFEDGTLRHILKIAEDGTYQRACPPLEVRAKHPILDEIRTFPTPCAVPAGWIAQ